MSELETISLKQYIRQPTHNDGHILDFLAVREDDQIVYKNPEVEEYTICDDKGNHTCDHCMNSVKAIINCNRICKKK